MELAHEALIRTWPRLRGWIDKNRERLRSRSAVLQAQSDWEQNGRPDDLLLSSGFALARAKELMTDPGDIAVEDIQEFVSLSFAHEKKRVDAGKAIELERAQLAAETERMRADLAEAAEVVARTEAARAKEANTAAEARRLAAEANAALRVRRIYRGFGLATVAALTLAGLYGYYSYLQQARLSAEAATQELQYTVQAQLQMDQAALDRERESRARVFAVSADAALSQRRISGAADALVLALAGSAPRP